MKVSAPLMVQPRTSVILRSLGAEFLFTPWAAACARPASLKAKAEPSKLPPAARRMSVRRLIVVLLSVVIIWIPPNAGSPFTCLSERAPRLSSEDVLHRELQLPRVDRCRWDLAEVGVRHGHNRHAPVRVIGHIERFVTKLQPVAFADPEALHGGKIAVHQPGPQDIVPARIAVGAKRFDDECSRVEKLLRILLAPRQIGVDAGGVGVDHYRSGIRFVQRVLHRYREGKAGLHGDRS